MAVLGNVARRWRMAAALGDVRRAAAFGETLTEVVHEGDDHRDRRQRAGPGPHASRDDRPRAPSPAGASTARKIFCTMSPAATVLFTTVSFVDDEGQERYGYARIPADAPGVVIHDDWDALGMRASGSHSVTFDEVELPASALRGGFPVGSHEAYLESNLTAGLFHAAASLGIAESALRDRHPAARRPRPRRPLADARGRGRDRPRRRPGEPRRAPRCWPKGTSTPARAASRRSSPRSRARRRSSTRRPCASSTARSR